MKPDRFAGAARRLEERLAELGRISEEPGRLTRTFLSPEMERAHRLVGGWMRAAGLKVRVDGIGNLIGRLESAVPGARTLILGSHLDTVRDAGRFDGALGVILPVLALAEVERPLPFAVEIVGFAEEEGVRFASAYLGSKGYAGRLRRADLGLRDAASRTVQSALKQRFGSAALPRPAHRPRQLLGYLETHIEQGPVLEAKGAAVGVVSAIAGQSRGRLTLRGHAGHAGTTPMRGRRDALAGAAELILWTEALARRAAPLVATVGSLAVMPNVANVIAGEAVLTLDLRHPRDPARRAALRRWLAQARRIARRRGLACEWRLTQDDSAVACAEPLTALLRQSVRSVQSSAPVLVSGAGHDAVVLAALAPVTMLFVRCRDGLSHHPDEFAARPDLEVALRVVVDFLGRLARREAGP